MHSRLLLLLLLLGICTVSFADDFKDFRRPTQSGTRLYLDSRMNLSWNYYDDDYSREVSNWMNGYLAMHLKKFRESEKSMWEGQASASVNAERSHREHERFSRPYSSDDKSRNVIEYSYLSLAGDSYPFRPDFGGRLNISGDTRLRQGWGNSEYWEDHSSGSYERFGDSESSSYEYTMRINAAVGYGKVRRASPVYSLHVLESRLERLGILNQSLQPETRRKLIDLSARSLEYTYLSELPAKDFWRDLETILLADPAFEGRTLSAYDWFKLGENIQTGTMDRRIGCFVGPVASVAYLHDFSNTHRNETTLTYSADTLVSDTSIRWSEYRVNSPGKAYSFGGLGASYHKPLGLRSQVDASGSYQLPLNPAGDGCLAQSDLAYGYILTDRLRLTNTFSYYRLIEDPKRRADLHVDEWIFDLTGRLDYWVENRIDLYFSLTSSQGRRFLYTPESDFYPPPTYYRNTFIGVGVAYAFMGAGASPSSYGYWSGSFSRRYSGLNPLP